MTVTPLPLPQQATPQPTAPTVAPIYQPAPAGTPADAPRVFAAIAAVMSDAMPVGKNQRNEQQNYKFRGIDDVMSAMAGPMRKHGVFILPTIADHTQTRDGKMTRTVITMRYHIYGPAGDCLIADVPGEAFDYADKSTNKAQSAALKYLLFTLFMLPVDGRSIDDGDRDHPEPSAEHRAEMEQRQQQRGQRQQRRQQGQQREQQPRRSQRDEPGPEQQQPQQTPRRDYLAEAQQAQGPEQFAAVRAAAEQAGAPAEFLAQLDAIAAQKRAAAQKPQQAPAVPAPSADPAQVAAQAENALRLAASRANLPELDATFQRVYGLPIEQATAAQLDQFRAQIEAAAAKGGQQ